MVSVCLWPFFVTMTVSVLWTLRRSHACESSSTSSAKRLEGVFDSSAAGFVAILKKLTHFSIKVSFSSKLWIIIFYTGKSLTRGLTALCLSFCTQTKHYKYACVKGAGWVDFGFVAYSCFITWVCVLSVTSSNNTHLSYSHGTPFWPLWSSFFSGRQQKRGRRLLSQLLGKNYIKTKILNTNNFFVARLHRHVQM